MVPNDSPAMIVTASPIQNTSWSSGMTPNTVVAAASTTGLRRGPARRGYPESAAMRLTIDVTRSQA